MTNDTPNLPAVQKQPGTALTAQNAHDDARFDRVMREAEAVYHSTFLPATLTKEADGGKFLGESQIKANCVVVANVAHDMGVGFMAVAQSMSQVHGKLMFEGKLIAAVIEQRLGVRLRKTYTGEPGTDSYGIKIWTKEDADEGFEPIDGTVGEWKTKERSGAIKAIWVGANKQKNQLFYMGARVWARLNAPGLMLGIVGDDEVDESAVADHLQAAAAPKISAGFASQDPAPMVQPTATTEAQEDRTTSHPDGPHKVLMTQPEGVDEKPPADAESSTKGKKASAPKAKKVDEKKGVSANLATALEVAAEEWGALQSEMFPRNIEGHDKAFAFRDVPDDDAAQAMLGEVNAAIDRGRAALRKHQDAQREAPEDTGRDPRDPTPAQIIASLDDVLRPLQSWAKIKETFSGFAKLQDWKGLGKADKSKCYSMVWSHANRLNVALTGKGEAPEVHPTDDATAYRCAIEACDDAGILEHMWTQVKASASYNGQAPGTKTALVEATEARLKQLKG